MPEARGAASPAARLRELLAEPGLRVMPCVFDALSARLVERAGFRLTFMSGFAVSASRLGLPDAGLISYAEMLDQGRSICDAAGIPVVGDADTGYGNPMNVKRTVHGYARAGFAAVMIEDQVAPKRCGHTRGKDVVPRGEAFARIKAACDARDEGADGLVLARTDARAVHGLDDAIERARAFADLGADILFVEAPRSEAEIERIAREVSVPQLFNWTFGALTPHVDRAWLAELGFELVLFSDVASVVHHALLAFHRRLVAAESLEEIDDSITGFDEFNAFVGLPEWRALEQRYVEE
jgi:2-methylisocitrate lyase-like PEP mutase family enzyme